MNRIELQKPIIIAGPCAAESENQVLQTVEAAQDRDIDIVRLSLWKPRTEPDGFDGVKECGIPWLINVAKMGIMPGTEVMSASHADKVVDSVIKNTSANVLIWIGSRNQDHFTQQEIAGVVAGESRVMLMIKNPPWADEKHWKGIIGHVLKGGASTDQLILCHRGFFPNGQNPNNLRNVPDFEMAMRIKRETGIPMIFDPSHVGGERKKVIEVAKQAMQHFDGEVRFDGLIVEVHHSPDKALTDAKQQLTWQEFDEIMKLVKNKTTQLT